jgi:hypothetical protein
MKKLLAFLLVFTMLFGFAACSGDESSDSSSQASSAAAATSSKTDDASSEAKSAASSSAKSAASSEAKSTSSATSSSATSSTATSSGTTSTPPTSTVKFTNMFVSFGTEVNPQVKATDSTSIRLTKVNKAVVAGDVALFTKDFGSTLKSGSETYKDFAVLVCTYDHSIFGYKKTSLVDNESDKSSTAIPADGFVVVIAKSQTAEIAKLKNIKDEHKFFPHGVRIGDLNVTIKKTTKAPTIDGKINTTEYGQMLWKVDENNKVWDYAQFAKDNYYVKGEVYATYDDNNFYLGVVVDTPENYNTCTEANAGDMWKYYCIQVNLYTEDPTSDYFTEHFDWAIDKKSSEEGKIRQYGFGVNKDNKTLSTVWMGIEKTFTGKAVVIRDEGAQKTYYEVSIPWKELGTKDKPFSISGVKKIGFALSINATNEADVKAGKWKNLKMRDGGGIINRNDFTKGATVTLG